jgi:DivIVA domain-containing protein
VLTVLALLGVLVVLFGAGVLATREGAVLKDAPGDIADVQLPKRPLQPEDVRSVRFGLAVRGYRMSEVDQVLERLAAELADRDRRLAERSSFQEAAQPAAPPVQVAQAPVEVAPLPAGEATEPPQH